MRDALIGLLAGFVGGFLVGFGLLGCATTRGGGPVAAAPASQEYRCEQCGRHEVATAAPVCHGQPMTATGR